jgi:hypothetical protein
MLWSSQWSLSIWLSPQYYICIPLVLHLCYMPCPSHPPWLNHSNYTWKRVQVMKLLIMQFVYKCKGLIYSSKCFHGGIRVWWKPKSLGTTAMYSDVLVDVVHWTSGSVHATPWLQCICNMSLNRHDYLIGWLGYPTMSIWTNFPICMSMSISKHSWRLLNQICIADLSCTAMCEQTNHKVRTSEILTGFMQ